MSSVLTAHPGTPGAVEQMLRSDDFTRNTSIEQALKYQGYLEKVCLPFSSIVALNDKGEAYTLPQLQVMGISQQAPLHVVGIYEGKQYPISQELVMIAGQDGVATFGLVFKARNPKASEADCLAAIMKLENVQGLVAAALNNAKKSSNMI